MGKAFKKAFDGFEINPSDSVWQSVNSKNIEFGNVNSMVKYSKIAVISAVAIIAIATIYYLYKPSVNPSPSIVKEMPIQNIDSNSTVQIKQNSVKTEIILSHSNTKDDESNVKNTLNNKNDSRLDIENEVSIINKDIRNDSLSTDEVVVFEEKKEVKPLINPPSNPIELSSKKVILNEEQNKLAIKLNLDTFKVVYGDNPVVCFGEDATLFVEDGFNYKWNTGDVQNKISVSPVQQSHYTVTVTNSKGQENIHEFTVDVDNSCSALFIPSAFTPNFDGQNDVFKAEGRGITQMHMIVYNKLGQKVFESVNIDIAWDGTFNGKLSSETYVYHVDYTDAKGVSHVKRGQVTLIK
ncbi:MAG: hypothetical protein DRI86_01975 [Bacteroidetes bacterium]|nr:MAG: hypothetical protein DRI86_01975 [Bacteroidota bacterium]